MPQDCWIIALPSRSLPRRKPVAVEVDGVPLVLFRDAKGRPQALLDRCPHRSVPLSMGWVRGDRVICRYHGWEFEGDGMLRKIPSDVEPTVPKKCATPYPVHEAAGSIWVWPGTGEPGDLPAEVLTAPRSWRAAVGGLLARFRFRSN
jgi:phenylpropionate dioxygenase-like ring-hydroxylating dioxygenase large terminal subunit